MFHLHMQMLESPGLCINLRRGIIPLLLLGLAFGSPPTQPSAATRLQWLRRSGGGVSTKLEGLTAPQAPERDNRRDSDWDYRNPKCKFVIVTGGVISGIGKGVTASSIGLLLKMMNLRPTAIKIDPYLNVDAGTMSPFEHGEVFVLDDGGETDLDLGNYERFMNVKLSNDSNLTTGKVYQSVIEKERRGEYLGKTVQVVPHITNAIQDWIMSVASKPVDDSGLPPNVCVIELGGTLGDIESMPFVEALRQLQDRVGYKNCCFLHVSMVPVIHSEQKTKPTQHSVKEMRALGLIPDLLVCRGAEPLRAESRDKISMFCQVPPDHVISVHDVSNIFRVPLLLLEQGIHHLLMDRLRIPPTRLDVAQLDKWRTIADTVDDPSLPTVRIGMVGKYTGLSDSYLSIHKALQHAAIATRQHLVVDYIDSSQDEGLEERLKACDGLLVPGGFGGRGLEGKLKAIRLARETGMPFLGICLGMQAAVIEVARNVMGRAKATSTEFAGPEGEKSLKKGVEDVIIFMPEGDRHKMGGTMRLGARTTLVQPGSVTHKLYRKAMQEAGASCSAEGEVLKVDERHRHRYEVNPQAIAELEAAGLRFVGKDSTGQRMEVVELSEKFKHPFFVAVQFHPEFNSRPTAPSPLFLGLLRAAGKNRDQQLKATG